MPAQKKQLAEQLLIFCCVNVILIKKMSKKAAFQKRFSFKKPDLQQIEAQKSFDKNLKLFEIFASETEKQFEKALFLKGYTEHLGKDFGFRKSRPSSKPEIAACQLC